MQILAPRLLTACCVLEGRSENRPGQNSSFSLEGEGEQNRLPPHVLLWYVDYFELKRIKAQRTEEELLALP